MRNVKRPKIPLVLAQNSKTWKRELLAELRKGDNADKKKVKTLKSKYAHGSIRTSLKKMYKFCCYCESRVRNVTVDHIEHRKPQAKFPEDTFEWDNLHLACPNCNRTKLDKWDENDPILDSVKDVPISGFLTYRRWYRVGVEKRGKTTVNHVQLNREELVEPRQQIYRQVMDIIEMFNNNPQVPDAQIALVNLKELSKDQFGSFVEYLTETFLRP